MDKERLRQAVIEKIKAELETITQAALMAREEATHEESKAENQYDMHAQEAAYLAEGQARLAAELTENLTLCQSVPVTPWGSGDPVGIGAVVTLESAQRTAHYWVGPRSGGLEVTLGRDEITVVTPASPLGRQLVGARLGSTVQLPGKGGVLSYRVIRVE